MISTMFVAMESQAGCEASLCRQTVSAKATIDLKHV
jgi:hypothetical protein